MSNISQQNLMNHLVSKIREAEIITEPFPHFFVEGIFPEDYYREILHHLPARDFYKRWTDVGKVKLEQYSYRDQFYLEESWLRDFPAEIRKFWQEFSEWFLSAELAEQTMLAFEENVSERFGCNPEQWPEVFPQAIFLKHRDNYYIGPHTDIPSKVVNILFYLPEDEAYRHLGTSIYEPVEKGFEDDGNRHYEFDGFVEFKRAPYIPNSAFGFVKTNYSWHGVAKLEEDEGDLPKRNIIQYMVYDNPLRAPRKEHDLA